MSLERLTRWKSKLVGLEVEEMILDLRTLLLVAVIVSETFSVVFHCKFDDVDWEVVVGKRYSCKVTELHNPEVDEVTQIIGDHLGGHSNADVEAFWSNSDKPTTNFLLSFPKKLESFFPNLVFIAIHDGRIASISSDDLAPWPNLAALTVTAQRIKSLDEDLFKYSPQLELINFSYNLLERLGAKLLSNLNKLTLAYFLKNTCINSHGETPERLAKLKAELLKYCPPTSVNKKSRTPKVSTSSKSSGSCFVTCSTNEEIFKRIQKCERETLRDLAVNVCLKVQSRVQNKTSGFT